MDQKRVRTMMGLMVALMLWSCTPSSDDAPEIRTADLPPLESNHVLTISDADSGSEELFFQQVSTVLSDSKGRIYIPDMDRSVLEIHIYDREGNYVNSFGGVGSGPGEFQSLLNLSFGADDRLFAFDVMQARNTIFREADENEWTVDNIFQIEGSRYSIAATGEEGALVLRQSIQQPPGDGAFWFEHEMATGQIEEGLREPNVLQIRDRGYLSDGIMTEMPFGRRTLVASDQNGSIYIVWSDRLEIAVYDVNLELTDSITVNLPNLPVSSEERDEAIDRAPANLHTLVRQHMPENKPVLRELWVDPVGNFWVHTYDSPEYLVIDGSGTPLASFDLPDDVRFQYVDEERIYAVRMGDEGYEVLVYAYQLNS